MAERTLITAEELRKLVSYDPETGDFTWRRRALRPGLERIDRGWNTRLAGRAAALRLDKKGYRQIGIAPFSNLFAHRLAWLYVYGEWPAAELDHINGDPLDNRIANLRLADRQKNMRNQKIRVNNTSGVKGVSYDKKSSRWYAYINVSKRMIPLGMFDLKDDAVRVRLAAEKRIFGEFMRKPSLLPGAEDREDL